jgi:NH3-dependent NAD+ synthetase/putative methionine-R-sulfoxide reductase with GAF domain
MNTDLDAKIEEILAWMTRQAEGFAVRGALVEIGGDVNSAVALAVTKRVFGDNTQAVILACGERGQWVHDAQMIADKLTVPRELLDLTRILNDLTAILPPPAGTASLETLRRRLKLLAHRHWADSRELLMVGSADRLELEFALVPGHPEPFADVLPLGHLLQSDIRRMGKHLGFPRRILDKPKPFGWEHPRKKGPASLPAPAELDGYLSEDPSKLSSQAQQTLQAAREKVIPLRRLPLHLLKPSPASEAEDTYSEDHHTYDRSIEALSLISKAITSDQYLEDILRLIVMVTAEVMKSSVCSLWLLDEKESVLRLRATQSIDSEYLKDRVLKVGEGVVGKVVAENRAYAVNNVLTDPIFKEKDLARRMGLVSMLSVPMRVGERVIGVINCYTSHPHVFSDLQMNLLTTVANQAAVAIEKTELMVQTKVISEELERRKIIERAKDILMKRLSLSGEEAYRWLQKRSMNTRKSMREVSEAVLLAMEG